MGTSYVQDYRTGRWVLDCGECGRGGGVRKRRCPAGYCPSCQLCSECFKVVKADGRWAEWHKDCARYSAEYHAREAAKDAEPEWWARSAFGDWDDQTPTGMVRVITRAGTQVFVKKDDYRGGNEKLPAYAVIGADHV